MSLRALAVLALVLVACVAAVLWIGRANPPAPPESTLGALLDGSVDKVTAVGFGVASATGRIARGPNGTWRIETPIAAAADPCGNPVR